MAETAPNLSPATVATSPPAATETRGRSRPRVSLRLVPLLPACVVVAMLLVAIFAGVLAPHSATSTSLIDSMEPPAFAGGSREYLLGTDVLGRDQLSRLIYGTQVSISAALLVLIFATTIGVGLGLTAGYFGGLCDSVIMRVVDITLAFPPILVALVLAVVYGGSFRNVVLIVTLFYWTLTARQVRAETLALKNQDFVTLARLGGASNLRIIVRHILPSVLPTVLVITTLQLGAVIVFESSLSFLGVGVPPPRPSWGNMIAEGRAQVATAWWLSVFPGLAIFVTVLSMNSLGDWLRDRLDPRLRQL